MNKLFCIFSRKNKKSERYDFCLNFVIYTSKVDLEAGRKNTGTRKPST